MPEKRSNSKFLILLAVCLVIMLASVGVIAFVFMNKDKEEKKNDNNNQAENPNKNNNSDWEAGFGARAQQAQLECEPGQGHQNYRTQQAFAVDPNNSQILYLGSEYRGVFKSVDGGVTWKRSDEGIKGYYKKNTTEKCVQEMGKIIIDPTNSNRLLLSRVESPGTIESMFSETAGVYMSEDAGATWEQLVSGDMNASGSKAIAIDPSSPSTIYYGTNNAPASYGGADQTKFFNKVGVLYKSTDNGNTWTELNTGIDNYLRASDVLLDATNPKKIFLATFRPSEEEMDMNLNPDQSKSLLLSEDGGTTWKSIADRIPAKTAIVDIMQSSKNPKNMFIMGQSINQQEKSQTFYSVDNGVTFKVSTAINIYAAAYDPHDSTGNRLLTYQPFASKPGMYESKDGGATWKFFSSLPGAIDGNKVRISNITWDPKVATTVYANGDAGHLVKSTDNGKTWTVLVDYTDLK